MTMLKEIVKRNFKLFRISVRCKGTDFMDIVVYQSNGKVAGTLHCATRAGLAVAFSSKVGGDVTECWCIPNTPWGEAFFHLCEAMIIDN